ncbi:hypothetical protein [Vagococcus intermedius]|uniref:Uncharacterized protein n=1 Tax=Vagococcus intermedius TaxID=2991418 RepID=A0AAF0CWR0_9ENTE|nr:hypothetical protein [Vagococcus intermedius]WEG74277.1 hypothetical protein OL234_05095 [Vagococcus intermedius]WEG76359.1 hypothetical protein OL235_05100 [Vagococcus intermedius]
MKSLPKISIIFLSALCLGGIYYHQEIKSSLERFSYKLNPASGIDYIDNETKFNDVLHHIVEGSKGLIISILYDQTSQTFTVTISDEVVFLSDLRKNKLITWLQPKLKEAFENSTFSTDKLSSPVIAKVSLIYENTAIFCRTTNLDHDIILSKN